MDDDEKKATCLVAIPASKMGLRLIVFRLYYSHFPDTHLVHTRERISI